MSITSLSFLWFLLIGLLMYYALPFSYWKKAVLLCAGLVFYASFDPQDFWVLGFVILYSYSMAYFIEEKRSKWILGLSVVPIAFVLCYFKYANFIFNHVDVHLDVLAPLGISFFTFKIIGYLVDVYRECCPVERSLLNYAVYVSFFPQISSGPIQKAESFLQQIESVQRCDTKLVRHGFLLVFFGYFEKMVIAERLYLIVNHCFSAELTSSIALIGSVAYAFQLYADFDAYSNIAIGIGEMFGIRCARNFHAPYLSRNIKEFWERWHISLSTWLKEYVYIPLGGSRKGKLRKYINLCLVFLISGLWHGSAWNFVLWGFLNGLFRVAYDLLDSLIFSKIKLRFKPLIWLISLCSMALNFVLLVLLWVFFRCSSIHEIQQILTLLCQFDVHTFVIAVPDMLLSELMITMMLTCGLILCDVLRYSGFTMEHFGRLFFPIRWSVYIVLLILAVLFAVYGPGYDPSKFIYIEF